MEGGSSLSISKVMWRITLFKRHVLTLLFALTALAALSQEQTITTRPVIWLSATEKLVSHDRWKGSVNIQQRQFLQSQGAFQTLASTTWLRRFSRLWAGGGFMFFYLRTPGTSGKMVGLPELRSYEQLTIDLSNARVAQWIRLLVEQRFQKRASAEGGITEDYHLNHRLRLKWQMSLPIIGTGERRRLLLVLSNEPMIGFGQDINGLTFDQNRLVASLEWALTKNLTVGTGYMNWLFKPPAGTSYDVRHVWLVSLSHRITQ